MKKPLKITKSDKKRETNREALYEFLEDNGKPLIFRTNGLSCKVYLDESYIGDSVLTTNSHDYQGDIDLFLKDDYLEEEISTDFCTKYEPMEYDGKKLYIGCYKNANRTRGYIISLEA